MTPGLLKPEVAHLVAAKPEIGVRRTRAKQYYDRNLGRNSAWPVGVCQTQP